MYMTSGVERKTKYQVNKDISNRTYDNIVFDSKLEMTYYRDIILPMYDKGIIKSFELQKEYILQPGFIRDGKKVLPIKYVADFVVNYEDGHTEVIDTKGFPDHVAPMKRKMFWYLFPELELKWMAYTKIDGWCTYEELQKKRKERKKIKQLKEDKE